jgi:esterase/lipase
VWTNIWNGIDDLKTIGSYVQNNWNQISLFGCSLGAFFSLHAYKELPIKKCLFQSPILNMEHLIQNMFQWFSVTEELLQEEGEILTPVDTLSWDYYCYVKEHPIEKWLPPTCILYGSEDQMQDRAEMEDFSKKFNCELDVSAGSDHPFASREDAKIVTQWLSENI